MRRCNDGRNNNDYYNKIKINKKSITKTRKTIKKRLSSANSLLNKKCCNEFSIRFSTKS